MRGAASWLGVVCLGICCLLALLTPCIMLAYHRPVLKDEESPPDNFPEVRANT
jgi:hypothetical protein